VSTLGLDIGTTGCKAVAFDDRGRELASAYRAYPVLTPRDGWAELDSAEVCESCLAVIAEAAGACSADPVRALAVSSQGEACTPVDADGKILDRAMVSFDTRSARIAESFSAEFGPEKLYRITGATAHPMFTLFKLLWVRENRPEVWAAARAFYCFEDLLHHRLGLDPAISWPMAGRTMMFDVQAHEWNAEILDAVGLTPDRLARPLASGTPVGTIPPAVARELSLPDGVIVAAGGHDQTVGALGVGAGAPGRAMYATGTVECICPAFAQPQFSDELFRSNLCTYDHAAEGMYATVAFCLTGGNILQWFRDQFGAAEVARAAAQGVSPYELLLAEMPPEPGRAMVLPYFTPAGTPYFDVTTPGAIVGLRLTTTRGEIVRALLEGVAYEMRLNLEILGRSGLAVEQLIVSGGGARSAVWTQLKADVLGKEISTATVAETGCLGAAILARAALDGGSIADLAAEMIRPGDLVAPDPARAAHYAERFKTYRRLYPALRDVGAL